MSDRFILLLEIPLARLADPRIMLFQEVLYTAHAHFDAIAANWALHFPIDDNKIVIGSLKSSKHHQFPSPSRLEIYLSVNDIPRFWQIFHSARHTFGNSTS